MTGICFTTDLAAWQAALHLGVFSGKDLGAALSFPAGVVNRSLRAMLRSGVVEPIWTPPGGFGVGAAFARQSIYRVRWDRARHLANPSSPLSPTAEKCRRHVWRSMRILRRFTAGQLLSTLEEGLVSLRSVRRYCQHLCAHQIIREDGRGHPSGPYGRSKIYLLVLSGAGSCAPRLPPPADDGSSMPQCKTPGPISQADLNGASPDKRIDAPTAGLLWRFSRDLQRVGACSAPETPVKSIASFPSFDKTGPAVIYPLTQEVILRHDADRGLCLRGPVQQTSRIQEALAAVRREKSRRRLALEEYQVLASFIHERAVRWHNPRSAPAQTSSFFAAENPFSEEIKSPYWHYLHAKEELKRRDQQLAESYQDLARVLRNGLGLSSALSVTDFSEPR